MSSATIKLIGKRVSLQSKPLHLQNVARSFTKYAQKSLIEYYLRREDKKALEIGAYLELETGDTDLCGVYAVLKYWYQHMSARGTNPSRVNMAKVTKYHATLYKIEDPDPLAYHWPPRLTHSGLSTSSQQRRKWRHRSCACAPTRQLSTPTFL